MNVDNYQNIINNYQMDSNDKKKEKEEALSSIIDKLNKMQTVDDCVSDTSQIFNLIIIVVVIIMLSGLMLLNINSRRQFD